MKLILKEQEKNKGAAEPRTNRGTTRSHVETASPPKLSDLGISKSQSSRWQKIARCKNFFQKPIKMAYPSVLYAMRFRDTSANKTRRYDLPMNRRNIQCSMPIHRGNIQINCNNRYLIWQFIEIDSENIRYPMPLLDLIFQYRWFNITYRYRYFSFIQQAIDLWNIY